jgi:hypothetical protein
MIRRKRKMGINNDCLNIFDRAVLACPEEKRGSIVDVMDTAEIVSKWFKAQEIPATAADIIKATSLILRMENDEKRRGVKF